MNQSTPHKGFYVNSANTLIFSRLAACVLLSTLLVSAARATHEVHHRYTIWGDVMFEDGTPLAKETIHLTVKDGTPMGTLETDEEGKYRLVLHVHDPDVNKVFDMRVRDVKKKVRLEFDPKDHETERGQRVDFTVKK